MIWLLYHLGCFCEKVNSGVDKLEYHCCKSDIMILLYKRKEGQAALLSIKVTE